MYLYQADKLEEGQEFIVTGDKSQLQPKVQLQEQAGGGQIIYVDNIEEWGSTSAFLFSESC
jgi:hypothetical protein